MWRALQAELPGEEHMLATNRTCSIGGPILVLDTDSGSDSAWDSGEGEEGRGEYAGGAGAQEG